MITFRLVTGFTDIQRRSFDLADPEILKATNVRPVAGGEWFQFDSAYKMARGGDNTAVAGTPSDEATVPSYPMFAEGPGRTDMQSIGKGTFLFLNDFEADTKIMDAAGLALGDALSVWDVDIGDGICRRGLAKASSGKVVGYVTRLPANNNGWLRFSTR
jgi:hypothetical protein